MKKFASAMVAAFAVSLLAGAAQAGAPENSWYIAPQVNALWLDDGRVADDDAGFTLAFGHTFSANWDAEFAFFTSEHDRAGTHNSLELQGFALKANRVFYREGRVNPFISFGLGRVKSISRPGADDSDLSALGGLGLLVELGGSKDDGSAMQLRADLGARRGLSDNSSINHPVDYVAGLGFQYNWGGTPARRVVDSDGDGVNDDEDKCPNSKGDSTNKGDGCPLPQDDDHDGVNNDVDKCPGTPAGAKVDANGCELDTDGDGVSDSLDQCPNTPAGAKVDAKGCELDADGDGVVDSQDKCPDTPKGDRVDAVGCSFKEEIRLPGVVFETGKAELKPGASDRLRPLAQYLQANPNVQVRIDGHTDSQGGDDYNQQLSEARAGSVRAALIAMGVDGGRIQAIGHGKADPVADNKTEAGRQQNRRVEVTLVGQQATAFGA